MNGSVFFKWGGVPGLQPYARTQNHGKLNPPPVLAVWYTGIKILQELSKSSTIIIIMDHGIAI